MKKARREFLSSLFATTLSLLSTLTFSRLSVACLFRGHPFLCETKRNKPDSVIQKLKHVSPRHAAPRDAARAGAAAGREGSRVFFLDRPKAEKQRGSNRRLPAELTYQSRCFFVWIERKERALELFCRKRSIKGRNTLVAGSTKRPTVAFGMCETWRRRNWVLFFLFFSVAAVAPPSLAF